MLRLNCPGEVGDSFVKQIIAKLATFVSQSTTSSLVIAAFIIMCIPNCLIHRVSNVHYFSLTLSL